jgi:hypothetical protein
LDGEVGDRTVMRPDMLPPAGPDEDTPAGSNARQGKNGGKGRTSPAEADEIEIDGDATVLVTPSDLSGEGAKSK